MIKEMKGIVKISQIGNSLGVIIPSSICKTLEIEKGSNVILELYNNQIIIRKEN